MTQHVTVATHRETRTWVWILVALGANTGWRANPVLLRYLQTVSHLSSMSLLLVGNTLVLILLIAVVLPRLDVRVFRTRILWLFPAIVVTRAVTHMLATRFTLAIYVQLIMLMAPFIVALLSTTLFRERLPPYTGRAISFSLVGALLMMSGNIGQQGIRLALTPTDWWGIGLALASNFLLATYMILVRRTAQHKVPAEAVFMMQLRALVVAAGALSLLIGEDWSRWAAMGKTDWLVFAIFTLGVLVGANIGQLGHCDTWALHWSAACWRGV